MTPALESKVKTPAELAAILARSALRVALAHGTFDLVHPGHIRHLAYVRERADVLVASVTSDRYVAKGAHRPYVPERLRAYNLAALALVDYVVVDDHPTPIELIALLRPAIFAKGADYLSGDDPRTREECATVAAYGGEVIYTPGDVVYSSSAIIESAPPNLAAEKLRVLMEAEGVTFADLRAALGRIAEERPRVHVVGDVIVDAIVRARPLGYNAKTPTQSVQVVGRDAFVGGAWIVALHLAAAGARVTLTANLGADADGSFAARRLAEAGVEFGAFVSDGRATTRKEVVVADGYRLLKLDTVESGPFRPETDELVRASLAENPAEVVVFSDFRHGVFHEGSIERLLAAAPAGAYRAADSQVASRWGNVLDFAGVDMIAANEREARFALGDQDTAVRPLGTRLLGEARAELLLLKLGARGCVAFRDASGDPRSFFALDSFARRAVDPVGAGDAMLAYAALARDSGPVVQAILGSLAAAAEVERDGNVPIRPEAIAARIDELERFP